MSLFREIVGKIQKSSYNELALKVLEEFTPKPITKGYKEFNDFDQFKTCGFDICKCYSSVLANNSLNIPIFNIFCDVKDYDGREIVCGEYLLEECVFAKYDGFLLPPGLYSWNLVKYLVELKMIEKKAIKKMLLPCGELPAEDLKLFVDEVYTKFAENEAKAIVNMFIGNMASTTRKSKDASQTAR